MRFFIYRRIILEKNIMCKQKRKKPKLYTLEQVVLAVNHWAMTTVETENVKQFINKEVKDEKQLSFFEH